MNRSDTIVKFKALSTAGLLAIGGTALGGIGLLGCEQEPEPVSPQPPPPMPEQPQQQQTQPGETPNPNTPPPPPGGTGGQNPR